MIKLNLQMFGGRGGSSGGGGGGGDGGAGGGNRQSQSREELHERVTDILDTIERAEMLNPEFRTLYEAIRNGESFSPTQAEARILNGFLINYGYPNSIHYLQTYDLNRVEITDKGEAAELFGDFLVDRLATYGGENNLYDLSKFRLSNMQEQRQTSTRRRRG